jgi:hypothetical protein
MADCFFDSHRALTPIIAGSVCGSLLVVAWAVGLIIYLVKQQRKRKRRAAGLEDPGETDPDRPSEKVIIPPDPALAGGKNWVGVETEHRNGEESGDRADGGQESPMRSMHHP